jgi:hypothetical protein
MSTGIDSLNVCWRGMSGVGKRTALLQELKKIAAIRKVPFSIQYKNISGNSVSSEESPEDGDGGDSAESGQITYETSLVHVGFDIARMSMQDKQVLRPIFLSLGKGSQVLAGDQGHGARILVLYHAHLLSSESVLLLQSCLEQNEGDISVWMTSEIPVTHRVRDWFVEVPIVGIDRGYKAFTEISNGAQADWISIFTGLLSTWVNSPPPTIADIKQVKAFVYELLMRNYRWIEATHCLLDVIMVHPDLSEKQRYDCLTVLAKCEATAGGYTIPSYRIPILWESLFVHLRNVLFKVDS